MWTTLEGESPLNFLLSLPLAAGAGRGAEVEKSPAAGRDDRSALAVRSSATASERVWTERCSDTCARPEAWRTGALPSQRAAEHPRLH